MENRKKIYGEILRGKKFFYIMVITADVAAYTISFLVNGLVKKDIFNLLEGREGVLGITSLYLLIFLNVAMPLLINLVKQINSAMTARARMYFGRKVKVSLFLNFFDQKMGAEHRRGYGETISLFRNECEDVTGYLMEYYNQLPKIVLCIAILFVMFRINPLFAAISLIPAFGMTVLTKLLGRKIVEYRKSARSSMGDVTEFLEGVLGNVEYFKLSVGEERLGKVFEEKCRLRSRKERKDRVLERALEAVFENASGLVMGIILLIAIPLYLSGRFSVGEFVMFEYYYVFLAALPDSAGRLIRRRRQADVALERILGQKNKDYGGHGAYREGILHLELECPTGKTEVNAGKGEVVLISGGSERTRSLILQRMFQICEDDLAGVSASYVPRQPVLFEDTVWENICAGEVCEKERLWKTIEAVDLVKDIDSFPENVRREVGKLGGTISGGQKKRIALARALYGGSEILFVDGLSENVDRQTEKTLIANVLDEPDKIIFVASDSEEVRQKASAVIDTDNGTETRIPADSQ